jgi:hypothetical protein
MAIVERELTVSAKGLSNWSGRQRISLGEEE